MSRLWLVWVASRASGETKMLPSFLPIRHPPTITDTLYLTANLGCVFQHCIAVPSADCLLVLISFSSKHCTGVRGRVKSNPVRGPTGLCGGLATCLRDRGNATKIDWCEQTPAALVTEACTPAHFRPRQFFSLLRPLLTLAERGNCKVLGVGWVIRVAVHDPFRG